MKKTIIIISLFIVTSLFAGHGWQRINYMQSTIFSAAVFINDKPVQEGDVLGAFVNDECRMIAPVFMHNDTSFVSSVIHGDKEEYAHLKLWIQDKDSIIEISDSLLLQPGGSILYHTIHIKN
ncbi:MAG: hypothetical protein PF481_00200 [Bacteroidales bacterium]|jgi:hypothetical protein|nr:hypothetical protein [Bacteroidales bacterium]